MQMTNRKLFFCLKKTIAIFLCASLILCNNVYSASENRDRSSSADLSLFSIPSSLGTVEESFSGTSGKTIIYIQDAHDSLEAQ